MPAEVLPLAQARFNGAAMEVAAEVASVVFSFVQFLDVGTVLFVDVGAGADDVQAARRAMLNKLTTLKSAFRIISSLSIGKVDLSISVGCMREMKMT